MQLFCFPICRNSTRWMQNKIWTAIVPVVACIFWTTNNAPINSVHALIWFFVNRDDDTASPLFDFGRYLQKINLQSKLNAIGKSQPRTWPPLIENEEKSLVVNHFTLGFGHYIFWQQCVHENAKAVQWVEVRVGTLWGPPCKIIWIGSRPERENIDARCCPSGSK